MDDVPNCVHGEPSEGGLDDADANGANVIVGRLSRPHSPTNDDRQYRRQDTIDILPRLKSWASACALSASEHGVGETRPDRTETARALLGSALTIYTAVDDSRRPVMSSGINR